MAIGEAIRAAFADCSEAGSDGSLEDTDPIVLQALGGSLSCRRALVTGFTSKHSLKLLMTSRSCTPRCVHFLPSNRFRISWTQPS